MSDSDAEQPDLAELSKSVDSIKDDLDELQDLKSKLNDVLEANQEAEQELQGDTFAMTQDLIDRAETEGFDSSTQTVADFIEFAQAEMGVSDEELQAVQEAADAMLQAEEAESLDAVAAEALRDFAAEHAGDDNGAEEPEEPEEDAAMADLEEQVRELSDAIEEIESDVRDLAEQPAAPRVGVDAEAGDTDEPVRVGPVYAGVGRDGDYLTR